MSLLHAPDPRWHDHAQREIDSLIQAVNGLLMVHHIGSTSVPGLPAKPVLDLLPVFRDAQAKSTAQIFFFSFLVVGWGDHGRAGRA